MFVCWLPRLQEIPYLSVHLYLSVSLYLSISLLSFYLSFIFLFFHFSFSISLFFSVWLFNYTFLALKHSFSRNKNLAKPFFVAKFTKFKFNVTNYYLIVIKRTHEGDSHFFLPNCACSLSTRPDCYYFLRKWREINCISQLIILKQACKVTL